MKKRITQKTAKARAWKAFSIYIRTRDCLKTTGTTTHGECYTCDVYKPFGLLDAGHLQGGRHNKYLLDESQVRAQCKYCNGALQGNGAIFGKRLEKETGIKLEELIDSNRGVKQYKVYELLELARFFSQKTNDL